MEFLETGEKIKKLRVELKIKQEELNVVGVSRNFISMIENGKRKLPKDVALRIIELFKKKANILGIDFEFDEHWLMATAKEQVIEFCNEKLNYNLSDKDIDIITSLVKSYNIKELIPSSYIIKADKLYAERLYEEAFSYYYDILESYSDEHEEKAFIYNKLGKCKIMMSNYIEAITYLTKCYGISLKTNNVIDRKNCLYNIALCYKGLGHIDVAIDYVNDFIILCSINDNFKEYMGAVILKANCYIELKRYQQAIDILNSNIDKFADPQDILLGYIYNSLGSVYIDINELENALFYLDKAYYIRKLKDTYNLPRTMFNKAKVLVKQEKFEYGLEIISNAIYLSRENKDYDCILKCYTFVESIYIESHDYEHLKEVYLEMISIFINTNQKENLFKVYIKLLSISGDSNNINELKLYIDDAMKYT